jgi:chloride channel protein, CIC family
MTEDADTPLDDDDPAALSALAPDPGLDVSTGRAPAGSTPSPMEFADDRQSAPGWSRRARHFPRAALVGLLAGLLAVAFRYGLFITETTREWLLVRMHGHPVWGWAVLPAVGLAVGSLVGWAVQRFAPEAPGSGIPNVKGVLIRVQTLRWRTLLPVKFLGGVLGIGAGLSLGREGPTVQMGAAVGQAVGELLHVPRRTLPQLISCGAGAGLAAAFNAPLAGFIFVLEELQRELSALTYGGALVAAVAATVVTAALTGPVPSFSVHGIAALPLTALPLVALLGVAGGVAGVIFNQALLAALRGVDRLPGGRRWLLTGAAGALVGLVAWWIPQAVGGGHAVADRLLRGELRATAVGLGLLLVAKLAMTVVSYASGAPGGIFAPMLLMGAVVGALFGQACAAVFPALATSGAAFAVVGMAAFFSASVRAPLTGIVLILEMTANQEQLFALCTACLVSYLVAERLRDRPIYEALLEYGLSRKGTSEPDPEPTVVVMGIQRGSRLEGKTLRNAGLPHGCLVVEVERAGRELLPEATLRLTAGDHIKVLTPGQSPQVAMEVVRMCVGG